ncbi:hypothetical protein [Oceanobacillus oncorhynchi]|uniref:hypothetical protein n=1 Tax=Oceanobacillus oncorhynchi TaxID=545501 RepID=UPI0034D67CC8
MYVSQLSKKAQLIIKTRILTDLLNDGIPFPEANDLVHDAMDSKLYDIDEHFNNQEIKNLLLI